MVVPVLRRVAAMLAVGVLVALGCISPAQAQTIADEASFTVLVRADGILEVTQKLTFTAAPGEVVQVLPTASVRRGDTHLRYTISDVRAELDSGAATFSASENTDGVEVRVAADVPGTVTLTYQVAGATSHGWDSVGDVTLVTWPLLSGLNVGVKTVTGTMSGPTSAQLVYCYAGPAGSVSKCAMSSAGTYESEDATFEDGAREPGDEIRVRIAFPSDAVAVTQQLESRWSLDRAFALTWPTVLAALGAGLVGAAVLSWLFRRTGVDESRRGEVTAVAAFVPVADGHSIFAPAAEIRPGHVGTLIDESVDPVDIAATIVDLADRGHLHVTELDGTGAPDWRLERRGSHDELAAFEQRLLDALIPEDEMLASALPSRLGRGLPKVREALYDDVVERGWFASRPDSTRSSWRRIGWLALGIGTVAAALLLAFTNLGLLALVLVGLGAATLWLADRMPRRTASGSAALAGLRTLGGQLATQPTSQLPADRVGAEISRLLGYTVVLGGRDRWLAALGDAQVPWYSSASEDRAGSLSSFVTTLQGIMVTR